MDSMNEATMLQGQVEISKYMFGFVDSMALKCAVELRIADIIHFHGHPITLSQIASNSDSPSLNLNYLLRLMRFLVRRKVFSETFEHDNGDTLYGLTPISRWLLQDTELSMAPMILFQTSPILTTPWHCFSNCVKEGGIAFKKTHGCEIFELASKDAEFNKSFNNGMKSMTTIITKAIISEFKEGFNSITSLVDVGGGTGALMSEIVKAYPCIKGINFDLPHVVVTAPVYEGVSHVAGDMFQAIPLADAVFLKWIMHAWGDEDCLKILKNCRKAIPEKSGKIIIVDAVLKSGGDGLFDDMGFILDLATMMDCKGGKERSEEEWKKLLKEAGFPRCKIIEIPTWCSIIEAYPQ